MKQLHPSHVTRSSDASTYDVVCVNCGESDIVPGGYGKLADPCPKPVEAGGMTIGEWAEVEKKRVEEMERILASLP